MKTKKDKTVYCLYVFATTNFITFKIEKGKFLGKVNKEIILKDYFAVEHEDNDVEFLKKEDIYDSENDALRGLITILEKKLK